MSIEAPLNADVGRRLRALREARGIRRERLALALEMGSENLRHYETGRQTLTLPMLLKIADCYGMSLTELVSALVGEDEICNSLTTPANGAFQSGNANYIYTESAIRLARRCEAHGRPLLAAAAR